MAEKSQESKEVDPSSVKIVSKFLDVFREEIIGLPLEKELEFSIDILSGTTLVSKEPYKMAHAELQELKVQVKELLTGQGFK